MTRLCALYRVTRTGNNAWRRRPVGASPPGSPPDSSDVEIFDQSGGTYGSPRMHRALHALGYRVSRRRVEP